MIKTIRDPQRGSREGLTLAKVVRFLTLPFRPSHLETYLAVERFEDIPVDQLIADGIEGLLLDADGTLGIHHARNFPESTVQQVRKMLGKGLKVAIYTNSMDDRFDQFSEVKVVTRVPAKPDRRGFEAAMNDYLHLDDPSKVCMIGDNYITDGGALSAGMKFIHVKPVKGNEGFFHFLTRNFAYLCARFYSRDTFRNSRR
ncbi:MAG: HAD family hydrolase [Nitrospinaceae bacterium]